MREELDRILAASSLWDGKVKVLQVTDARERTLELRVLASAPDAPSTWQLRCEIREKLVAFLQSHHPDCLPRLRAELWPLAGGGRADVGRMTPAGWTEAARRRALVDRPHSGRGPRRPLGYN
jgi:hypothetical protein